MLRGGRSVLAVLALAALLLVAPAGAVVAAGTVAGQNASGVNGTTDDHPAPIPATEGTNATPTVNQTGEGALLIQAGGEDAHVLIVVDFSLFAGMPGPGQLRFASAGILAGERVVGVELGIRFLGIGNPLTFLGNPSSRFTVEANSVLSLPFLEESTADGRSAA